MPQFESETVQRFASAEEIEIQAKASPGRGSIRTPVWVVVVGSDVYVRAVRGIKGKWYRSIMADGDPAVSLEGKRVRVRPFAVVDRAEIDRVTEAYRAKYGDSQWLGGVLKPHTLEATLRLEPASSATPSK